MDDISLFQSVVQELALLVPAALWRTCLAALALLLPIMLFIDGPVAVHLSSLPNDLLVESRTVTDLGKGMGYIVASALAAFVCWIGSRLAERPQTKRIFLTLTVACAFILAATAVSGLLVDILKVLVGRARPVLIETQGVFGFHPLNFDAKFNSFPSGHATTVVAFYLALALLLRPAIGRLFASLLLVPAVLLAGSRIVVGAHYVSDVLAGAIIAVLVTVALYRAFLLHGFDIWAMRGAKPPQGPTWRA